MILLDPESNGSLQLQNVWSACHCAIVSRLTTYTPTSLGALERNRARNRGGLASRRKCECVISVDMLSQSEGPSRRRSESTLRSRGLRVPLLAIISAMQGRGDMQPVVPTVFTNHSLSAKIRIPALCRRQG